MAINSSLFWSIKNISIYVNYSKCGYLSAFCSELSTDIYKIHNVLVPSVRSTRESSFRTSYMLFLTRHKHLPPPGDPNGLRYKGRSVSVFSSSLVVCFSCVNKIETLPYISNLLFMKGYGVTHRSNRCRYGL